MRRIPVQQLMFCGALIAVLCPAASAAPRLVLSSPSVTVGPIAPGSNAPAQNVEAQNAGDGSLSLTATPSAPWISAAIGAAGPCKVLSGTCNQIAITLSTTALAAGTYNEFVLLTDPNAVDSPQEIALNVTIAAVPDSITLYVGPYGSGVSAASSYIYPASAVAGISSTTGGGNWLSFVPKGHSIIASPDAIQVSAQPGQAAGTYTGTVVISGSSRASDNKTVQVTLIVSTSPVIDTTMVSTIQIQGFQGGGKFPSSASFNVIIPTPGIFNNGSSPIAPLAITGATASGAFLSAAVSSSNTISITADAGSLSPGIYRGTVTIASNAANNAAVSIPVIFIVYPAGPNVIFSGGIVNPTTYASEPFAPGEIVALFGLQLAAPGTSAVNPGLPPLATTLGSVQVLVNGVAAPLFYVGPPQINFQIPYSLVSGQTATVQVVSSGTPGNSRSIGITATSPRLLLFPGNYGIAFNTDGSIPLPSSQVVPPFVSHPAKPGDVLVIYGVGFGQTSPAAVEGIAANGAPLLQNAAATTVDFGGPIANGKTTTVGYSGLTPTAVGLYQINVTVPLNAPLSNSVPVTATVGTATSNIFNIAISADGK
jgi:uncharacterized protein (TIGR03437 family)